MCLTIVSYRLWHLTDTGGGRLISPIASSTVNFTRLQQALQSSYFTGLGVMQCDDQGHSLYAEGTLRVQWHLLHF
jgi:hypothetical protein